MFNRSNFEYSAFSGLKADSRGKERKKKKKVKKKTKKKKNGIQVGVNESKAVDSVLEKPQIIFHQNW